MLPAVSIQYVRNYMLPAFFFVKILYACGKFANAIPIPKMLVSIASKLIQTERKRKYIKQSGDLVSHTIFL